MWKDSIASYPSVNIVKSSSLVSNGSCVYKHYRLGTSPNQDNGNKMFADSWDKFFSCVETSFNSSFQLALKKVEKYKGELECETSLYW